MNRSLVPMMLVLLLGAAGTRAAPHTLDDPQPGDLAASVALWIAGATGGASACPADAEPPCFALAGTAVFDVSTRVTSREGRLVCRVRCAEPIGGAVVLDDDGARYRVPHDAFASCPLGTPVDLPDEIGRVRARRRARLLLPTNRGELEAALFGCSGSRTHVRELRRVVRPSADATTLTGHGALRLEIEGSPVIRVRAATRFVGARAGTALPEAPEADEALQACRGTPLRVQCRVSRRRGPAS